MPIADSDDFRQLLKRLLPGFVISEVAKPSGQRLVYFGEFSADPAVIEGDAAGEDQPELVETAEARAEWGDVVVKVAAGMGAEQISYLQREIRVLNELDEPCYPTLHFNDVFTRDPDSDDALPDRLFITIEERIDGQPLSTRTDAFASEVAAVGLLIQLTEALAHLWSQRPSIIHRDIKPENILIKGDGQVVVIDLGISREEGAAGVTHSAAGWGPCTPQHSSPEQALNDKRNITFKSDFFALGTLGYQLIAGTNPFNPNGNLPVPDVLSNVAYVDVPPLSDAAGTTAAVSKVIERMMQKRPYRRPRTPDALLNELRQSIGGE